jgi:DnaK suppressor protein
VKQKDIQFFRRLLRQRMHDLQSEAARPVGVVGGDEHFADPGDRASVESDRHSILRIRERESKLMMKIEEALRRLDDGAYGVCDDCGEQIGIARLKARPVTTMCIDCKSAQENEERKNRGFSSFNED